MEWIEIIVHTTTSGADMVSDCLMQEGASGTMVEDRADIPDPAKPNGIWEIIDPALLEHMPTDVLVHAWFEPDHLPERLDSLRVRLAEGGSRMRGAGSLQIETVNIPDQDWAEMWKKFYKPFRAGQHLVVKPSWEDYEAREGDHIIEIDPGMAFGSGQHETTAMCLQLLEETIHGGEKIIDVGTGSGILAIGAALTGAGKVLAIDIDPDAVRVAKENVIHHGLEDRITTIQGDLLKRVQDTCDICVANIIADVICYFAEPLKAHIQPGGLFICSGIVTTREPEVLKALNSAGYTVLDVRHKGEWTAILSRRPG